MGQSYFYREGRLNVSEVAHVQRIIDKQFQMDVLVDPYNKRLRVDDYRGDVSRIVEKVEELAVHLKVEKVIIIGRKEHYTRLLEKAFQCEAMLIIFSMVLMPTILRNFSVWKEKRMII